MMSSSSSYSPHLLKIIATFSALMLFKAESNTIKTWTSVVVTLLFPSITTSTKSIAVFTFYQSLYKANHWDTGRFLSPSPGLSVNMAPRCTEISDWNSVVTPYSLLLASNYYSVAASVGLKSTDIVVDLPAPNAPITKMCFEASLATWALVCI